MLTHTESFFPSCSLVTIHSSTWIAHDARNKEPRMQFSPNFVENGWERMVFCRSISHAYRVLLMIESTLKGAYDLSRGTSFLTFMER